MTTESTSRLGASDVIVSKLGLGLAPVGDLLPDNAEVTALSTINRAWELGLRYFDTAPLYGHGRAERRAGEALRGRPRNDFVVSTKVGRLIRAGDPARGEPPGWSFDFSYDGVLRSFAESLRRLELDRIDVLLVHDPDDYHDAAMSGAFRALSELREQGVVRAIGAGMNQSEMLLRFADEVPVDCFLLAGRYTLLDQTGLVALLPKCESLGISVIAAGVLNSGVLAAPRPGALFDYAPASAERLRRARHIEAVCRRNGIPLIAAALQFPLAHAAVACVLVGARSPEEIEQNVKAFSLPIPPALWSELAHEGLLPPQAPVP